LCRSREADRHERRETFRDLHAVDHRDGRLYGHVTPASLTFKRKQRKSFTVTFTRDGGRVECRHWQTVDVERRHSHRAIADRREPRQPGSGQRLHRAWRNRDVSLSFSGLAPGTKYLGSVAYSGVAGMPNPTIVRVDP
jgi:hypothetical protein